MRPPICAVSSCYIVDEHTREALAMEVGRSITGDDVVAVVERLVTERGAPRYLRMDNPN